eukprot:gene27674-42362_t
MSALREYFECVRLQAAAQHRYLGGGAEGSDPVGDPPPGRVGGTL